MTLSDALLLRAQWWCDDCELAEIENMFDFGADLAAVNACVDWKKITDDTPQVGFEHQVYFCLLIREAIK